MVSNCFTVQVSQLSPSFRFPYAGFRNEIEGRNSTRGRQETQKTRKTTEESRKMTNGKLLCSVNSCGQRKKKKYFVSTHAQEMLVFKRLKRILSWQDFTELLAINEIL